MFARNSVWIFSVIAVALLGILAAYQLSVREGSHRESTPDSELVESIPDARSDGRITSAGVDAIHAGQRQAASSRSGLHQRLLTMSEPHRNHLLFMILRDAGAECAEVIGSQHLADDISTWHAHCGEILTYSIVIDDLGSTTVYPILYGDFLYGDFDASAPLRVAPIEPRQPEF